MCVCVCVYVYVYVYIRMCVDTCCTAVCSHVFILIHSYMRHTHLVSSCPTLPMHRGTFRMEKQDGKQFDVRVPPFALRRRESSD